MKTEQELSLELMRRLYRLACISHGKALVDWQSFDTPTNRSDPTGQAELWRRIDVCYAWEDAKRHIRSFCEVMYGVAALEPDQNAQRGKTSLSAVFETVKSLREVETFANAVFEKVPKQ